MAQNDGPIAPRQYVAYLDLSGGRNTKKDPHALDRNQLAASDNTWMAQGNTIGKRPGNISIPGISAGVFPGGVISAGGTGIGVSLIGMVEGRFAGITTLVVQGANNQLAEAPVTLPAVSTGPNPWEFVGSVSGGVIQAAQLFDPDPTNPNGPDGSLFIVNGINTPAYLFGMNRALRTVVLNQLPTKADGSGNPITPAYVATLFSSLFYAGEPTDPSMVYISDPFRPQSFTSNLVVPTGTITGSSYIGLPVGRGDGVGGGSITALAPMGSAMAVYKQSAIYTLTQLGIMGDQVWGASLASASVGCVAPRSLVAFDTFHCFLGIDGVYMFTGGTAFASQSTQKISGNNPDLFDGGFSPNTVCLNRQTAIGVRYGNRYVLFFDDGNGTGTPAGYCTRGVWFDFDKLDADGLPSVGTMTGMNVGGVAPLRGPADGGNFAWVNATADVVGSFNAASGGQPVYSDFGVPITVNVAAKADMFSDIWGDEAPAQLKVVDSVEMLMSFPIITSAQQYTFNGLITYDQLNSLASQGFVVPLSLANEALVGSAIVGLSIVGVVAGTPAYDVVPLFQQAPSTGFIVQFSWQESSIYPWTSLGFMLYINSQLKVGNQSG